jgi:hypothetical protein
MNYLPMYKLGARETSTKVIQVGIFLPGVDSAQGYAVFCGVGCTSAFA